MSHFIHGSLSNILILPLLYTLLILKELMFDVCVCMYPCRGREVYLCMHKRVWKSENKLRCYPIVIFHLGTGSFIGLKFNRQTKPGSASAQRSVYVHFPSNLIASVLRQAWHLFMWVLGINIAQGQVLERDADSDSVISTTKLLLSISSGIILYF